MDKEEECDEIILASIEEQSTSLKSTGGGIIQYNIIILA